MSKKTLNQNYIFDLNVKDYEIFRMLSFSFHNDDVLFWLKNGLLWYYAFNHEEGIECFKRALTIDRQCAMAHYGISMCHGPNYNTEAMTRGEFPSGKAAYDHALLAFEKMNETRDRLSSIEVALIEALQVRYNPISDVDDGKPIGQNTYQFSQAMKYVFEQYPQETCVSCLYVESLLNMNPWKLWNLDTGVPETFALEAQKILQNALAHSPLHPGLHHFMIHLSEMSPCPEMALESCLVLKDLCPDAGHLTHMPSHIHVLLGMWEEAIEYNSLAFQADEKYAQYAGISNCYTGYRIHNMHFISYAAMFAGG